MKEIRYIFNIAGFLAIATAIALFINYLFANDNVGDIAFLLALILLLVGEIFVLIAPSSKDVDDWNKKHNKQLNK